MITISGTATTTSITGQTSPASGVTVGAYKSSDETTAVASTTTDAQGAFSLMVPTNGVALDGFLKATKSGNVDTYLYPPAPLTADFTNAPVIVLTSGTYSGLIFLGGGGSGDVIGVEVVDTSFQPIAGATVSGMPAATKTGYTGSNGTPDTSATQTTADGRGYLFGEPAGSVTVSAAKSGLTFQSHAVKVHAGQLTITAVSE